MTARRDLAESIENAERDLDRLFAPLAPRIRRIVERRAVGGVITHTARLAILRDVDALLDTVYGRERGAPSRLGDAVVARANEARFKPVAAEVEAIRGRLRNEPELLQRMEQT